MTAFTNFGENAILNALVASGAGDFGDFDSLTVPLEVALFTADPGEAGATTNEVSTSGTAYARADISFAAVSGGSVANDTAVNFTTATSSWGTVTHAAICEGAGGSLILFAALANSRTVDNGVTASFAIGDIVITLD